MKKLDDDPLTYWGLVCLLAFSPLVRGGHQVWAAFLVSGGMGCLLALFLVRSLWRVSPAWVWSPSDFFLFAGLVWVAFGLTRPFSPPDSIDSFLILLGAAGCFFLSRNLSASNSTLNLAIALAGIGGMISLVGLIQGLDLLPHGWWNPPQFLASTFINHNHFAAYLGILLPLSFLLWFTAPLTPPQRFLVLVSSALIAIGFVLSSSRGAWLSLVFSAFLVFIIIRPGWMKTLKGWHTALILAPFFAAFVFLISQPPLLGRAMTLLDLPNDPSFQMRQAIWQATGKLAQEALVTGQGVGSFLFTFPRFRPVEAYRLVNYAHNEYLQLVVELGLVGLFIFLIAGGVIARRMIRLARFSQTSWKQAVGFGGLIGMSALAVHSLVDFPWHIPAVTFEAAAVAGLVTGVTYRSDTSPLRQGGFTFLTSRFGFVKWIVTPVIVAGTLALAWPLTLLAFADVRAVQGDLEGAIRLAPFRVAYHERLGDQLTEQAGESQGEKRFMDLKKASEAYRKARVLVPHHARSAHRLAGVLRALGNLEEAESLYEEAVQRDPQNPLYWKHWAQLKQIRGQASQAAAGFRRASELAETGQFFPHVFKPLKNPDYFVRQGEFALLGGQTGLAETFFKIAQEFQAGHPGAQAGLAIHALAEGDLKKAHRLMIPIQDPFLKAKWFAALSEREWKQGRKAAASAALEMSLKLDPSNVLSRHLELLLTKIEPDQPYSLKAVERLFSLNQPPVFFLKGPAGHGPLLVWEPEFGEYAEGQKAKAGWSFFKTGSIEQRFLIPPGKVRFSVTASGTSAEGAGPKLVLFWNGRLILAKEVTRQDWAVYEAETEVRLGESLLTVDFPNDLNDLLAREDRNLKLEKITASWESI